MKNWAKQHLGRDTGKLAVVGLMLGLWLFTFALAASPQLHGLVHDDAHSTTHACLITHLQQHSLLAGVSSAVVPAAPPTGIGLSPSSHFLWASNDDHRLSPSRAPPSPLPTVMVAG